MPSENFERSWTKHESLIARLGLTEAEEAFARKYRNELFIAAANHYAAETDAGAQLRPTAIVAAIALALVAAEGFAAEETNRA